jgi:hypothetical protein
MAGIRTGAIVTVHGVRYRVVDVRSTSGSGSKFFGKFSFTLANDAGERFTAYGKTISHNSRLTPVMG